MISVRNGTEKSVSNATEKSVCISSIIKVSSRKESPRKSTPSQQPLQPVKASLEEAHMFI
jgi:hypothetical protein